MSDADILLDGPGSRPWRSDTCWDCAHYQGFQRCAAFPEAFRMPCGKPAKGTAPRGPATRASSMSKSPCPLAPLKSPSS